MKVGLYSIQDANAGFMSPVVDLNDATAMRNFAAQVDNSDVMKKFSNEFTLFKIGVFDTETGMVDVCVPPLHVANASSVKE